MVYRLGKVLDRPGNTAVVSPTRKLPWVNIPGKRKTFNFRSILKDTYYFDNNNYTFLSGKKIIFINWMTGTYPPPEVWLL